MRPVDRAAPRVPRCPHCQAPTRWHDNPHRPFCSLTCRLIDLGRWLDEGYRVAGAPLPNNPSAMERPSPDIG